MNDATSGAGCGHGDCGSNSECGSSGCEKKNDAVKRTQNNIKQTILVMSGKGGVGKSSIAVNLAVWLSMQGQQTGLMDIDLHGPSVPRLLDLEGSQLFQLEGAMLPCSYRENLKVVSIGFLLQDRNTPVIWRGPAKHGFLDQFVNNVQWGDLDTLVVDCPPGTGDEVLSIVQLFGRVHGAIIVTTPQELAMLDVRKCISFCRELKVPILGLIENMSGLVCPHCNHRIDVFSHGSVEEALSEFELKLLGSVPMTPDLAVAGDTGKPLMITEPNHPAAQAMSHCFQSTGIMNESYRKTETNSQERNMRFAIPVNDGKLSVHFGHCQQFAIVEADQETKTIKGTELLTPPAHEPGVLPAWLSGMQVQRIIAGGMGQRAQMLFTEKNIEVIVGAPVLPPEELVLKFLDNQLACGENVCDH